MESSNGMNAGLDYTSSPASIPSAELSTHVQSQPTVETSERNFRQSEVNDIVRRAKQEAVEKDRRLRIEQPEYAQRKYEGTTQSYQPTSQSTYQAQYSQPQSNETDYRKIVAEEMQRQRDAWEVQDKQKSEAAQAQQVVNKFWSKISAGKGKYSDFDNVAGDIELARFPNTVQLLAEHIDNSADVLYELGKDRLKMAQLESLAYLSPNDAIKQAQRLAQSIKDNANAANTRVPSEPLSQLRQTNIGLSSGERSVTDYRAMFKKQRK